MRSLRSSAALLTAADRQTGFKKNMKVQSCTDLLVQLFFCVYLDYFAYPARILGLNDAILIFTRR